MNIASMEQQPKIRYEVITGSQHQPEIVLARPVLNTDNGLCGISGQTVAMMPPIISSQPQFLTQIPSQHYITSQSGVPLVLPETASNEENVLSFPTNVAFTSAGGMIKLEVGCTSSLSSRHVPSHSTYVNSILQPKCSLYGSSSKLYANLIPGVSSIKNHSELNHPSVSTIPANPGPVTRTVPIQYIPTISGIDKGRELRFADSTASVAMDLQSLYVSSKMETPVISSGASIRSTFAPLDESTPTFTTVERNYGNHDVLPTNASVCKNIAMSSPIMTNTPINVLTTSAISAGMALEGKQNRNLSILSKVTRIFLSIEYLFSNYLINYINRNMKRS